MANESGVTVHFLGGQSDVARFYDAADFLLHPAYSESAGKVLLEALTHGLPVLTTDTCGYAPHIIKADGGIVIKSPFTQTSLNDSLVFMIQDSNTRESWSQNALQYAASNDLYSCHKAAAMTIEQIIEKSN
jgi:UDP-glucose:(heptosyl)LPS alpha-1,3-glucosyltransferase